MADLEQELHDDYDSCKTECVSGDWFGDLREVDLANLKQKSHDDY